MAEPARAVEPDAARDDGAVPGSPSPGEATASGRGLLRRARAPLLLAAVLALFFLPAIRGAGVFAYRDTGRMHGPHKRLVAEALAHGRLPEWNPYGGLGFPLVGGGVDAVQHPLNALLVALPFQAGFTAWALLSVLLAAVGMLVWLRSLGLAEAAAVTGALALSLSGYLVSSTDNLQYLTALATVPLLLAAAHAFAARGGPARAGAVALASALAAAAGDPQSWAIALVLLPVYAAAFVDGPPARARVLRGVAAIALGALGAAPFILPVAAWIPHSSRGDPLVWIEHERYGLLPVRALELLLPGLFRPEALSGASSLYRAYAGNSHTPLPWVASEYVGATVLALAAYGAARSRRAALLVAAAGAFVWAAMGRAAGFGRIAERVPMLSGFRYWEKVAFFAALLACAAAAYGLDAWLRAPDRARRLARAALLCGAILLLLGVFATAAPARAAALVGRPGLPAESATFARNLAAALLHAGGSLLAVGAVAALSARGRVAGRWVAAAVPLLVAADLATANAAAYVLTPASCIAPRSPLAEHLRAVPGLHRVVTPWWLDDSGSPELRPFEREMVNGAATLGSGWNVDYRVGNFEPYTGMIPARLMRFRSRTGYLHQLPQVGMWGIDHAVIPLEDGGAERIGLSPPYAVVATDRERHAALVEIPHRPRAYVAEELVAVDRRGAMEFVLDPASLASRRTAVEAARSPVPGPASGTARIVADAPESVEVSVTADRPPVLVLHDMFAPGWTAAVVGAPAQILAANYLARGVVVPGGEHVVSFRYSTPLLAEGWSLAGLLAVSLLAWTLFRRQGRGRPAAEGAGAAPLPNGG